MADGAKGFERFTANALAGRIRRDESGKFLFEIKQLVVQAVVITVGNTGFGLDIIGMVVRAEFRGKLGMAFAGVGRRHGKIINEKPAGRNGGKIPFDGKGKWFYVLGVQGKLTKAFHSEKLWLQRAPLPQSYTNFLGRKIFLFLLTVQGLAAFALITLGVIVRKFNVAAHVVHPLVWRQISRAGVRLLPLYLFMAVALGFLVIGQTFAVAAKYGAVDYIGTIMVTTVVRELGPLMAATLALARVGTANVIELGTARALGEVEALEAAGIDPVHYLIAPRVIGMTIGVFCLTVYLILVTVLSGYLFVFLQNVPLTPHDYFEEVAGSLSWLDFALLALKSGLFGFFIGIVTCYHGLAQPLRLDEISRLAVRAISQGIVVCVFIDALFFLLYLSL